jgi:hypothetical protein
MRDAPETGTDGDTIKLNGTTCRLWGIWLIARRPVVL